MGINEGVEKQISLLLVDDNEVFRDLARRFLQISDEAIVGAANWEAALDQARASRPQVIVAVLSASFRSGLEAVRGLRQAAPDVGIITLGCGGAYGYKEAALASGADDFVERRTMTTDLLPALHRVARVRAAQNGQHKRLPFRAP